MPISWKNYLSIRRTTEEEFISLKKIKTYDQLLATIDKRDVEPPLESVFNELRDKVFKEEKTAKRKSTNKVIPSSEENSSNQKVDVSKRKPATPRKRTRRSNAKNVKKDV